MSLITVYPAAMDLDMSVYQQTAGSYPPSAVVGKSTSNTGYGVGVGMVTGAGSETKAYFSFDLSQIPSSAIIRGVSCKVSIYGTLSLTTRSQVRYILLCKGSTGVGTRTDWTTGSSASTTIPEITSTNGGSWTRSELDNLRVLMYATRSSTNSTTTMYIYVRGIDLTVEYEENYNTYSVTIQNNGYNVDSVGSNYFSGDVVPIVIREQELPQVTLDGVDITNQFNEQILDTQYTASPNQSSYTGLSSGSNQVGSCIGYTAENPYTSNINWYGSSGATVDTLYAQYTFNLSGIPLNATNIQITCKIAGKAENTTYNHSNGGRYSEWGLCCNGTSKSGRVHATSKSIAVYTLPDTGTWTREELNGLLLRHYVGYYGGSTNGVTLTISYTLPGGTKIYTYNLTVSGNHTIVVGHVVQNVLHLKINGEWISASRVYLKLNGYWVEIEDLQLFFSIYNNNTDTDFIKS